MKFHGGEVSVTKELPDHTVARRTLPDELIGHLRDMIQSGQLRAGSRISVTGLCRRFSVSRTPLREALKILAVEGLIVLSPNRSAVVSRPSRERIEELIPIISALEVLAGELACARIGAEGLKRLRSLQQQCAGYFDAGDVAAYMSAEAAMRNLIFEFAANRELTQLHQVLHAKLRFPPLVDTQLPEWSTAVKDLELILQVLEMKNADMCSMVMRRYIRHRVAILRAFIESVFERKRSGGAKRYQRRRPVAASATRPTAIR